MFKKKIHITKNYLSKNSNNKNNTLYQQTFLKN